MSGQKGAWAKDVVDIAEKEIGIMTVYIQKDPAWTGDFTEYFRDGCYTRLDYLAALFWQAGAKELQKRLQGGWAQPCAEIT